MSDAEERPAEAERETPRAPRSWDEESVALLMEQFRRMVVSEVRNMKLETVESLGQLLARRIGFDREVRDLSARVDYLGKTVEAFGVRLEVVEKALKIPAHKSGKGPLGASRELSHKQRHD